MTKKLNLKEMTFGKASGTHEPMDDVLHGWDKRIEETEKRNNDIRSQSKNSKKTVHKKNLELPHEQDKDFVYGMSTHDIDTRADPFLHSNSVIEQRKLKKEAEEKKLAEKQKILQTTTKKKADPMRPTAASIGHTFHPTPEPGLKETFKMKS